MEAGSNNPLRSILLVAAAILFVVAGAKMLRIQPDFPVNKNEAALFHALGVFTIGLAVAALAFAFPSFSVRRKSSDGADELAKLALLHAKGVLSDEEFAAEKARWLNK